MQLWHEDLEKAHCLHGVGRLFRDCQKFRFSKDLEQLLGLKVENCLGPEGDKFL